MIETKFKNTEIGLIPEDWEVKKLGEIGVFSKGSGIARSEANSGSIPAIRYGEIYTSHNDYIKRFYSFISEEVASNSKLLNKGDLLFACSGETKEEIAKTVAFIGDERAYCGGDIIVLSPTLINVNSLFLGYLLNTPEIVKQKASKGQGDAVVHISSDSIKSIQIPLPPLPEQRRIAEVLSQADELIKQWENVIAKKRDIKTATMQLLLTGKKRLNGFKDEWVEKKLGEVCVRFATGLNPRDNFKLNNGGSNFYVTIKNFRNGILYLDDDCDKIDDDALALIQERSGIAKGDLLLSSIGRVGDPCIIKETPTNWNINESIFAIRPDIEIIDVNYLYYLLNSDYIKLQFQESSTGSTLTSIKLSHLKQINTLFPPTLSEQRAIAKILSDMDEEIKTLELKVEKLRNIKSGMMQQLLSGKIRLVGDDAGNVRQFVENNFGQMPYAAEDEAEFGL